MISEIIRKYKFDKNSDRLGPDCPFTHWKLYFKSSMKKICKEKFAFFGENAEFRAGAYADGCSKIYIGKNIKAGVNIMSYQFIHIEDYGINISKKSISNSHKNYSKSYSK